MSSGLYLEHYLDSLETLPIELQRNFTLMRDLDTRAQDLMRDIDCIADDYMRDISSGMGSESKKCVLDDIQGKFNKVKEYGDDKVQLAIQTYELVDKHIRRLDSDLVRFEAELQEKALNTANCEDGTSKKGRKKSKEGKDGHKKRGKGKGVSSEDDCRSVSGAAGVGGGRKKHRKGVGGAKSSGAGGGKGAGAVPMVDGASLASVLPVLAHPADVLDMPVDPNEPTYCLCHQVSYGEMIGCDNPECPIEWFHFTCVNLTTKPKGKWFCPKCSADRKKK